jgi:hypothetical protein
VIARPELARLSGVWNGTPLQRVLAATLALDAALIIGGLALAPEALRSASGVGIVLADVGLMAAICAASVVGPLALDRYPEIDGVCLWVGLAFAVAYDGDLLLDFAGRPVSINEYSLFIAAAVLASSWATLRSGRLSRGVIAGGWALVVGTAIWSAGLMTISYAYWHTRSGYGFWLRDGAVSDFHHTRGTDLWLFLLQDIQGAVFFHPFLSLTLGLTCGTIAAGTIRAATRLSASPR